MNRLLTVAAIALVAPAVPADDPVFSGPQVGEKLPPLTVRGVFDGQVGGVQVHGAVAVAPGPDPAVSLRLLA